MKNKKIFFILGLIILACFCFTTCENFIMKTWWREKEADTGTGASDYVKYIITEVEREIYIYVDVIEYVTQIEYVQLPPEIIYKTICKTIVKYETLVEEVIITQTVYETIIETIYETVKEYIEIEVPGIVTTEQMIEYILEHETEVIEILKTNVNFRKVIKEVIINEYITEQDIIEIISEIPPEEIIKYLTVSQLEYLYKQLPPEKLIQNIRIINIEFIMFAGESDEYNGEPGRREKNAEGDLINAAGNVVFTKEDAYWINGTTPLTSQEKTSNGVNISNMAKYLFEDHECMIILHGHANPVTFTLQEKDELKAISLERARDVKRKLIEIYDSLYYVGAADADDLEERISVTGYDGERNLSSSSYAGLNRRVEMILFKTYYED